jgi:hypothetical protein
MSDFTGFTLNDTYRAIAAEREREIARNRWRHEHRRLTASDAAASCCALEHPAADPGHAFRPRPSPA